jgi:hypothetical protein
MSALTGLFGSTNVQDRKSWLWLTSLFGDLFTNLQSDAGLYALASETEIEGTGFGVLAFVGSGDDGGVEGELMGFGVAIATPLLQINLPPDFWQVYFFPAKIDIASNFVHFPPAVGLAA